MVYPSAQHLAAVLMLLSASYWPEAEAHVVYHVPRGHGGFYNKLWPTAFLHPRDMDLGGAFRPFHSPRYHRGDRRRPYTAASPIVDMFQEVVGDIKRGGFGTMHVLVVSATSSGWEPLLARNTSEPKVNS